MGTDRAIRSARFVAGLPAVVGLLLLVPVGATAAEISDLSVLAGGSRSLLLEVDRATVEHAQGAVVKLRGVEVGGEERAGLVVPSSSRISFRDLNIPSGAHLEVGLGSEGEGFDGPVAARVSMRAAQGEAVALWTGRVDRANHWYDEDLDLGCFAGRSVELLLESFEPEGAVGSSMAWSRLRLSSPARPERLGDRAVVAIDLLRDLRGQEAVSTEAGRPVGMRSVQLRVPAGTWLEMGVSTPETVDGVDPLEVAAWLDGELIFHRSLSVRGITHLAHRVPLPASDGRLVELCVRGTVGPPTQPVRWERLRVVRERRLPRIPATGRNLLLLVIDTLRAERLGAYGYPGVTTPHLDRLARGSLLFENAIAPSSWTVPSMASLFTGRYPHEHGVSGAHALPGSMFTVAEVLGRAGFTTVGITANPLLGGRSGFEQGFERYACVARARATTVNELFRDWLSGQGELRWFAYLHYLDPHQPYDAPPPARDYFTGWYEGAYREQIALDLLAKALRLEQRRTPVTTEDERYLDDAYDAEVQVTDAACGEALALLRKSGLAESSVVAVVADHGEELLEHRRLGHAQQLYGESIQVPVLIAAPGLARPLLRTRLLELQLVPELVLPLLNLPESSLAPWGRPRYFTSALSMLGRLDGGSFADGEGCAAISDGAFRYLQPLGSGRAELYDLVRDPQEQRDVGAEEPVTVRRLARELRNRLELEAGERSEPAPEDPAQLEQLHALGYLP